MTNIAEKIKKKRGSKTTLWVKGKSANPGGRTKLAKSVGHFKKISYENFVDKLQEYGNMTHEDLGEELKNPELSNFNMMFGKVVYAAAEGERHARELLMDRLWGKAKETTLVAFETEHEMMRKIPMDDLIELYKKHNQPAIEIEAIDKKEESCG